MRAAANYAWCNRQILATLVRQTLERFLATGIVTSLFDRYPAVAKMAATSGCGETSSSSWKRSCRKR